MKKYLSLFVLFFLISSCSNVPSSPSTSYPSSTAKDSSQVTEKPSEEEASSSSKSETESVSSEKESTSSEKDPYINRSEETFYANYVPATSYQDALYRSEHYFRSGDLTPLLSSPQHASYQPKLGDTFIRNSEYSYSSDGNSYTVYDGEGKPVKTIYKGGAYITIEDVCAYVMAFGNIPANYVAKKSGVNVKTSPWGKYLRLNFSHFYNTASGSYANEPKLPTKSGTGHEGEYQYRERDIGGKGYNDGQKITRDTLRLVFSYKYGDDKVIKDSSDRYVFFTGDHYRSYEEYLNYYGGFGEKFDYIKKYVPVVSQPLAN